MSDPIKEYGQRVAEAVRTNIIDCYQGHVSHRQEIEREIMAINLAQIVEALQQAAPVAQKPVATVRVRHEGYSMELSKYVAYALPDGLHDLYAALPPAVAVPDERAAFELFYAKEWRKFSQSTERFSVEFLANELKEMRNGDQYGEHQDYLNFMWEGWKARAAEQSGA